MSENNDYIQLPPLKKDTLVLCQDLVQVKIRNFSLF